MEVKPTPNPNPVVISKWGYTSRSPSSALSHPYYFSNLPKNILHNYIRSTTSHANTVSINPKYFWGRVPLLKKTETSWYPCSKLKLLEDVDNQLRSEETCPDLSRALHGARRPRAREAALGARKGDSKTGLGLDMLLSLCLLAGLGYSSGIAPNFPFRHVTLSISSPAEADARAPGGKGLTGKTGKLTAIFSASQ